MKASINDAVIQKGKCHFEKIHSHSNYYFSYSALVTLISRYSIPWQPLKVTTTSTTKKDLEKVQ